MKRTIILSVILLLLTLISCQKDSEDLVNLNPEARQGKIEATITDQDDAPVAGVTVGLSPGDISYESDSEGKILTDYLDSGDYTVTLTRSFYVDTSYTVTVAAGRVTTANLTIIVKGSIEGTVYNPETGEPVKGAKITTTPVTGNYTTNDEGKYKIGFIDEGSYVVKVSGVESIADIEKNVVVHIGKVSFVNFGLVGKGSIEGTIIDRNSNVISGEDVEINPGEIKLTSSSEGKFIASYLDAGTYTIEINKDHYVAANFTEDVENGMVIDESYMLTIKGSI